jgi:hypothetical protein
MRKSNSDTVILILFFVFIGSGVKFYKNYQKNIANEKKHISMTENALLCDLLLYPVNRTSDKFSDISSVLGEINKQQKETDFISLRKKDRTYAELYLKFNTRSAAWTYIDIHYANSPNFPVTLRSRENFTPLNLSQPCKQSQKVELLYQPNLVFQSSDIGDGFAFSNSP